MARISRKRRVIDLGVLLLTLPWLAVLSDEERTLGKSAKQPTEPAPRPTEPGLQVERLKTIVRDEAEAIKVNEFVYQATGNGNAYMVVTTEGNVIIDTRMPPEAPQLKQRLQAINSGPAKYIVVTHAHFDHVGGINLWREEGMEIHRPPRVRPDPAVPKGALSILLAQECGVPAGSHDG